MSRVFLLLLTFCAFGCKDKLEGCLPVKPDLVVNLFTKDNGDAPWLSAYISEDENRCIETIHDEDGASGGCRLVDDTALLFQVSASFVESATTTTQLSEITVVEKWTIMSPRARDGHRDEKCVEEFVNRYQIW